jgi:hypothetical protein
MRVKYTQLLKGCIALIITIAVLYSGQALWQNFAVDAPLDKALSNIDGVNKVVLEDSKNINDSTKIYVTLSNVANLQKTYNEISETIDHTLKGSQYSLEIKDNPSSELEQAYYEINNYVQKAIVDGDFPALEAKVREKSGLVGASAKVYVDNRNIYLQLAKNGNYLYSVVTRDFDKSGGELQ